MILLRQFGVNAFGYRPDPMGLFTKLQLLRTSAGREHIKHRVKSWRRGESHVAVKHLSDDGLLSSANKTSNALLHS